MKYFFSSLFKIVLALFGFAVIYKIFLYIVMKKLMRRIISSTDEEKSNLVRYLSKALSAYRILFWLVPITMILFPVNTYFYLPDSFVYAVGVVIMLYAVVLEDYFYRKTIIRIITAGK